MSKQEHKKKTIDSESFERSHTCEKDDRIFQSLGGKVNAYVIIAECGRIEVALTVFWPDGLGMWYAGWTTQIDPIIMPRLDHTL